MEDYEGTLLFVSHDRYFVDRFATRVWVLEDGTIRDYRCGYEKYRSILAHEAEKAKAAPAPKAEKTEKPKAEKPKQKGGDKALEKKLRAVEREVEKQEALVAGFDPQIAAAASDYQELTRLLQEKEAAEAKLEELMEQWSSSPWSWSHELSLSYPGGAGRRPAAGLSAEKDGAPDSPRRAAAGPGAGGHRHRHCLQPAGECAIGAGLRRVLGAALEDGQATEELQNRLELGLQYLAETDGVLILSGGDPTRRNHRGPGHGRLDGIPRRRSEPRLPEDQARDTRENLQFSRALAQSLGLETQTVLILTSDYHQTRAQYLAHAQGQEAVGLSARRRPRRGWRPACGRSTPSSRPGPRPGWVQVDNWRKRQYN